ncbi:MAG: thiamine phosphate synthase [bacterium]
MVQWERILDANLNRLNESLKLIEDIIRFTIKDRTLLTMVRHLRRNFLSVKKTLPLARLIQFRDSKHDPGRRIGFDTISKKNMADVAISNFTRAKESSRVLEEILKSVYPKLSKKMKEVRFLIYDIEKSAILHFQKVFDPSIYVLLDNTYVKKYQLKQVIEILGKNGATMIQLRVTTRSDREFMSYARLIRKMLKTPDIRFIVNNRLDIAIACGADGVHLGQSDMPIDAVRYALGDAGIIGLSVHNVAEAKKAETDGADYLGVGSVFKTSTKADAKVCGLRRLKAICRVVNIPVIGIGGINSDNYRSVLNTGASGIAVASYLFKGNLRRNLRSLTVRE